MQAKSIGSNQTEITLQDGTQILVSYSTPVACFIPSLGYARTETKHSVTTSKHINKWLDGVNAEEKPQSYFDGLMRI